MSAPTPRILALCEDCQEESNCHEPHEVRYVGSRASSRWLCRVCWDEQCRADEVGEAVCDEAWRMAQTAEAWVVPAGKREGQT